MITTGLLHALQGKGIEAIAELSLLEQRALVEDFRVGFSNPVKARKRILIPQLHYFTNDSWPLVDAFDGPMGWPLLQDAGYAGGHLYVFVHPSSAGGVLLELVEGGLSREDAYALCSVAVDFEITQAVDGTKGVHAMIPKSIFK